MHKDIHPRKIVCAYFDCGEPSGNDLRLLVAALRSPSRPAWLIPATAALAVFTFDPFNVALPVIGVIDDLILLPLLLRWLVRAAAAAQRPPVSAAASRH